MKDKRGIMLKGTIAYVILFVLCVSYGLTAYANPLLLGRNLGLGDTTSDIEINSISDKYPGSEVTISGQTGFSEVNLKILYPNGGIYNIERILGVNGSYSHTFRLSENLPYGTYTVIVGKGDIVTKGTFKVKEGKEIPEPEPDPEDPNGSEDQKDPEDSDLKDPVQKEPDLETPEPEEPESPIELEIDYEIREEEGFIKIEIPGYELDEEGTAFINIDKDLFDIIFKEAGKIKGEKKTFEFIIPESDEIRTYKLEIPARVLSEEHGNFEYKIVTNILDISMPSNMFFTPVETVVLSITKANSETLSEENQIAVGTRPVVQLNFNVDGKDVTWENPKAMARISIPYTPEKNEEPEKIAVWYIDDKGSVAPIYSGRYNTDTGRVIFTTTHFNKYAVVYVDKQFEDISEYPWAQKEIEVLASKGIVKGTSTTRLIYSPSLNVTRADYIILLVRALSLSSTGIDENFIDVKKDDYFYEEVGIAKKLGITNGVGGNKFAPRAEISREDMMTLTARTLNMLGVLTSGESLEELDRFKDTLEISEYAVESVASLVKEGLILGTGELLYPKKNATRAEVAAFIYRIYNR